MKKYSILLLLFSLVFNYVHSQELSQKKFDSLLTKNVELYFDNKGKRYYGCGMNLDCMGLPVYFNKIILSKPIKRIELSGFINPMSVENGDTLGTNVFKIFIAKPIKGKLKNIRLIAEVLDTVIRKSNVTNVNLNSFSFKTKFRFGKHDCLYIESGELFRLKEYHIGYLLR